MIPQKACLRLAVAPGFCGIFDMAFKDPGELLRLFLFRDEICDLSSQFRGEAPLRGWRGSLLRAFYIWIKKFYCKRRCGVYIGIFIKNPVARVDLATLLNFNR